VNTIASNASDENNNSSPSSFFARVLRLNRLFLLTVVLPTLVSALYFGIIASDVYISETRFVVRSPERQTTSSLGALLKGTSFSRSQEDSYSVQDYIFSRDALRRLDSELDLKKIFSSSKIDIFNRFAGLDPWYDSYEDLHRYYQKKIVSLSLDNASSITTLTISAFSADIAHHINQQLLEMSEELVNQLNERGRQDMIRFAAGEVAVAENNAKTAALALSNYRNQKGVIDPEQQSAIQLQQIAKLQEELIATQAQLSRLQTFTSSNPQIPSLKLQVQSLRREIEAETSRVAGGDRSLANKAAEYQRLALDREFADKQLASALTFLEQARNEAQRKQLYLERIVQPSKPDRAMEPRRFRGVLATFVFGLIAWGILTMLVAGIREHRD